VDVAFGQDTRLSPQVPNEKIMANLASSQIAFLVLIAIAVALGFYGASMILNRAVMVKGRVRGLSADEIVDSEKGGWKVFVASLLEPIANLSKPKDDGSITGLRAKFAQAGWRSKSTPALFFGSKAILALVLPFFAMLVIRISGISLTQNKFLLLLIFLAAIGYYLPNLFLANRMANRSREIFESFPDATDLVIVCIEAGLGLDMAIARTGREMAVRSQALADEMQLIGTELRMGATRERALRNFASRTGVDEISMFVAMVLQADRFGTSIAESLRIHAESLRLRRRLRAEEAAAKIPLKLLFPLIFMIFPSLLLVLMGPAMISVINGLSGVANK
jgi:tight adherence protein C